MVKKGERSKSSRLSVREKTYRLLKKQLLTGQFDQNQRLTEEALAQQLGVSRTPVREALHKLELEGLVKAAGARGFAVPEETVEEKNELFEIRGILEGHALASLCGAISGTDREALQKVVDQAEQACTAGELERVFELNTIFHDFLYGLIARHKPRLYSLIEDMRRYVLRYRLNTLGTLAAANKSIAGHRKILMALDLGDPGLCEKIMRDHVDEARRDTRIDPPPAWDY